MGPRLCNPDTVTRYEKGGGANVATVQSLQRAIEAAGVVFIQENGGGAGVRLAQREDEGRR